MNDETTRARLRDALETMFCVWRNELPEQGGHGWDHHQGLLLVDLLADSAINIIDAAHAETVARLEQRLDEAILKADVRGNMVATLGDIAERLDVAVREIGVLREAVAALSPEPPPAPPTPPAFDAVMKLFKDWAVRVMLPSQFSHNDGLRFEQMARERFEQPPTEAR